MKQEKWRVVQTLDLALANEPGPRDHGDCTRESWQSVMEGGLAVELAAACCSSSAADDMMFQKIVFSK